MADSAENVVDLKALVADHLNGVKGFANTKKLKKMGLENYCTWLEGELAGQIAKASEKKSK